MKGKINRLIILIVASLALFPCVVIAQGTAPIWLDNDIRNLQYSQDKYYSGFAEISINQDETYENTINRAKQRAIGELSEKIRVTIHSLKTQIDVSIGGSDIEEQIRSQFSSVIQTGSQTEVTGINIDSWYNEKNHTAYAFAYVSKADLENYYKSNLFMNLTQVEGLMKTANDLVIVGEKAKARGQCELAKPLFDKIRWAQDMITAIDPNSSPEDLLLTKTETMQNLLTQMQAQLAQSVYVYVEDNEDLFNKQVNIVANQLKAELAKNGCSFVENQEQADFKLKITVSTRHSSYDDGIVFCFADAQVELYDIHKQKIVYSDEIAQKGGGISQDKAGRKAMADVVLIISEKLKPWIEN